jgi:hypothetical protein
VAEPRPCHPLGGCAGCAMGLPAAHLPHPPPPLHPLVAHITVSAASSARWWPGGWPGVRLPRTRGRVARSLGARPGARRDARDAGGGAHDGGTSRRRGQTATGARDDRSHDVGPRGGSRHLRLRPLRAHRPRRAPTRRARVGARAPRRGATRFRRRLGPGPLVRSPPCGERRGGRRGHPHPELRRGSRPPAPHRLPTEIGHAAGLPGARRRGPGPLVSWPQWSYVAAR